MACAKGHTAGCSSARLEHTSGGRGVASSNLVTPTGVGEDLSRGILPFFVPTAHGAAIPSPFCHGGSRILSGIFCHELAHFSTRLRRGCNLPSPYQVRICAAKYGLATSLLRCGSGSPCVLRRNTLHIGFIYCLTECDAGRCERQACCAKLFGRKFANDV